MTIITSKEIEINGSSALCILIRLSPELSRWYSVGHGNSSAGLTLRRLTARRDIKRLEALRTDIVEQREPLKCGECAGFAYNQCKVTGRGQFEDTVCWLDERREKRDRLNANARKGSGK